MVLSIIMVTYNAENAVKSTLDSVAMQNFNDYEVLVIDGCSKDNTIDIVKSYGGKIQNLRFYSEPDKGIYDAMNKGVEQAEGEYIYFLNAGDILYDGSVLSSIAGTLDGERVVFGNAITLDVKTGQEIPYRIGEFSKYRLAYTNICHQTIFYPRKALAGHRYNLKYRLFADWALNLELWRSIGFKYVNKSIVLYENGGVSATQEDKIFASEQKRLILKNLGLDAIVYLVLKRVFRWK